MGTEEFWVPAALAALSSGAAYANQKGAQSRQQSGEVQNILDQQRIQSQARGQIGKLTNQIGQSSPTAIASKSIGDYVSQLRNNAAGSKSSNPADVLFGRSTSSLPTSVNGNARYNTAVAGSNAETQKFGDTLATEMGNIDAPVRQRQNEAGLMQDEGTNLNLLGAESYTKNFADRLRADAAGQQNPWLALTSSVLGGAANSMSKNAGGGKSPGLVSSKYSGGYQPTADSAVDFIS